jgi:hypothetical protein
MAASASAPVPLQRVAIKREAGRIRPAMLTAVQHIDQRLTGGQVPALDDSFEHDPRDSAHNSTPAAVTSLAPKVIEPTVHYNRRVSLEENFRTVSNGICRPRLSAGQRPPGGGLVGKVRSSAGNKALDGGPAQPVSDR